MKTKKRPDSRPLSSHTLSPQMRTFFENIFCLLGIFVTFYESAQTMTFQRSDIFALKSHDSIVQKDELVGGIDSSKFFLGKDFFSFFVKDIAFKEVILISFAFSIISFNNLESAF